MISEDHSVSAIEYIDDVPDDLARVIFWRDACDRLVPTKFFAMDVDVPNAHKPKRSFGKHPKIIESPAYDASEEDNDPLSDDPHSTLPSVPPRLRSHPKPAPRAAVRHQLASSLLSDSDGVDSPTYDGDIESSATAGPEPSAAARLTHHHHASSTSTFDAQIISPSPVSTPTDIPVPRSASIGTLGGGPPAKKDSAGHPVFLSPAPLLTTQEPAPADISTAAFNPAALTPADIQAFVQKAIDGEEWRKYKINPPPTDRPVRVYADGALPLPLRAPAPCHFLTSHRRLRPLPFWVCPLAIKRFILPIDVPDTHYNSAKPSSPSPPSTSLWA